MTFDIPSKVIALTVVRHGESEGNAKNLMQVIVTHYNCMALTYWYNLFGLDIVAKCILYPDLTK